MSRIDALDIVIRRKGGRITAGIPQLGLYAKGDNANAALHALEAKKKVFEADLKELGELDTFEIKDQPVANRSAAAKSSGDIVQFAIKAGIVAAFFVAAVVVSGVLIGPRVEHAIESSVNNVKSIRVGGTSFWSKVENELDRMASPNSDLPEAKKQKLLADLHAIADKWRPFATELQSLVSGLPNQSPQAGKSANK
jgi:hypothetical protein